MGAAGTGAGGVPGGADAPDGKLGDVYRDILQWSASLARWQNELLRRLLRAKELREAEASELATAAVAETEQQTSNYPALSANDLPMVASAGEHRLLAAMRGVRNMNALRADQTLSFGPQLTVVYGDNASGKSGYCRVLKKIYRARVVEDILGDVRAEAAPAGVAAATFVVATPGGAEQAVAWTDGAAISDAGRFAVLDSACSLTYVRPAYGWLGGSFRHGEVAEELPRGFVDVHPSVLAGNPGFCASHSKEPPGGCLRQPPLSKAQPIPFSEARTLDSHNPLISRANSRYRQKAFASAICRSELQRTSNRAGFATRNAAHRAREMATLKRFAL